MGVWAFILCTGHKRRKKKNKNHETIPSRFSLNRKQRSVLFDVICVQYMKFWLEFRTIINIWTNRQFIRAGKVYIWLSVWEFQKLCLWQPCVNKLMHVENWETDHLQHDLNRDISYKFTLAWVFVSHACTQITENTFINDLVLFRGIIRANEGKAYSIIMSHDHFHNSPQLHP